MDENVYGNVGLADTKLDLGATGHCQSSEADVLHSERLSDGTRPNSKIGWSIVIENTSPDLDFVDLNSPQSASLRALCRRPYYHSLLDFSISSECPLPLSSLSDLLRVLEIHVLQLTTLP